MLLWLFGTDTSAFNDAGKSCEVYFDLSSNMGKLIPRVSFSLFEIESNSAKCYHDSLNIIPSLIVSFNDRSRLMTFKNRSMQSSIHESNKSNITADPFFPLFLSLSLSLPPYIYTLSIYSFGISIECWRLSFFSRAFLGFCRVMNKVL